MKNETIVIDLDNTICTGSKDYERCIPKENAVKALTMLKENNNFVIIHTARSVEFAKFTIEWLRVHKIPYDLIKFGKPLAKLYIDDKAYKFEAWNSFIQDVYNVRFGNIKEIFIDVYERVLYENLKFLLNDNNHYKIDKIKMAMKQARKVAQI